MGEKRNVCGGGFGILKKIEVCICRMKYTYVLPENADNFLGKIPSRAYDILAQD